MRSDKPSARKEGVSIANRKDTCPETAPKEEDKNKHLPHEPMHVPRR